MAAMIEDFESARVIPLRANLEQLKSHLRDSDPLVIAAQTRLEKYEGELKRRREALEKFEKQIEVESSASKETQAWLDSQLKVAYGDLKEKLSKLRFEKNQYLPEIESLKENQKRNQAAISGFLRNRAEMVAVEDLIEQLHGSGDLVDGCLLLNLSVQHNRWFVSDARYTSYKEGFDELQKFLDENPNATKVMPPKITEPRQSR